MLFRSDIEHIAGIAAGAYASYAFTADGQVYTWGQNTYGQLADGSAATKLYAAVNYYDHYTGNGDDFVIDPTDPDHTQTGVAWNQDQGYLTDIRSIAVGAEHSVMIRNDGYVLTSGRNDHGQLGGGDQALESVTTPMIVSKAASATGDGVLRMDKTMIWTETDPADATLTVDKSEAMIAVNGVYTLPNDRQMTLTNIGLFLDNGTLLNVFGLDGTVSNDNLNLKVSLSHPIVDVIEQNTEVDDGQGGKKTVRSFLIRPLVSEYDAAVGTTVVTVTEANSGAAVSFTLVLTDSTHMNAPMENFFSTQPMVAVGANFAVALRGDGTVWTWGNNEYGQLGIDSKIGRAHV